MPVRGRAAVSEGRGDIAGGEPALPYGVLDGHPPTHQINERVATNSPLLNRTPSAVAAADALGPEVQRAERHLGVDPATLYSPWPPLRVRTGRCWVSACGVLR